MHSQIGCALKNDLPDADHACQQAERVKQLEEVTGVVQTQTFINV
ncbi:hypothetical protein ACNKHU_03415 [Shigella flexneri]